MKKSIYYTIAAMLAICPFLQSCNDDETYADQKKHERELINTFIKNGMCVTDQEAGDTILYCPPINTISEEQFLANDSTTDVSRNEYVLFSKTGVYMQIIRKGCGSKLESGTAANVQCRYIEFNISGDSIQSRNNNLYYVATPDEMTVTNTYGTFTASFLTGVMKSFYSSASVPAGWLVPLTYIKIGRQESEDEEISKVRIIVPHGQGQQNATDNVYPCFYEITYQRGR